LMHFIKESGWTGKTHFKSKLATQYNNLAGMRKPRQRYTNCLSGSFHGHATYSHWIYSVIDYMYWQQHSKRKADESFLGYLQRRGYNNNKHYTDNFRFKFPDSLKTIFVNNKY